jgi:hypothetical protein
MSSFECKVSELNGNLGANNDKKDFKLSGVKENNSISENTSGADASTSSTSTSTSTSTFKSNSIYKLFNEKNVKILILITFLHFFLHSDMVLEFVNCKIPSLSSNLMLNTLGKLIIGLLIGFSFIVYSSFFQDP